jgi:predicted amidohydrolase
VVSASGGDLAAAREACKAAKVGIVLGISERVKGGHQLLNSLVFTNSAGTLLGTHRKLQPTYAERYIWSQGSGHTLRTYGFDRSENESFTVGGLCCWENTMNLARQSLIESGHQILAAAWPALSTPVPNEKHGSVLLRFEQFVKVQLFHASSTVSTVAEDGSEYSRSHEYIMHCQLGDPCQPNL